MATLYTLLILWGLFFLQTNLYLSRLLGGKMPDLLIIAALYAGLVWGKEKGGLLGLGIGLVQDILSTELLGPHALAKGVIAWLAGEAQRHVLQFSFWVDALFVGGAIVVDSLCFLFLSTLLLPELFPLELFLPTFFSRFLVTLLIGTPLLEGILHFDSRWKRRGERAVRGMNRYGSIS